MVCSSPSPLITRLSSFNPLRCFMAVPCSANLCISNSCSSIILLISSGVAFAGMFASLRSHSPNAFLMYHCSPTVARLVGWLSTKFRNVCFILFLLASIILRCAIDAIIAIGSSASDVRPFAVFVSGFPS